MLVERTRHQHQRLLRLVREPRTAQLALLLHHVLPQVDGNTTELVGRPNVQLRRVAANQRLVGVQRIRLQTHVQRALLALVAKGGKRRVGVHQKRNHVDAVATMKRRDGNYALQAAWRTEFPSLSIDSASEGYCCRMEDTIDTMLYEEATWAIERPSLSVIVSRLSGITSI